MESQLRSAATEELCQYGQLFPVYIDSFTKRRRPPSMWGGYENSLSLRTLLHLRLDRKDDREVVTFTHRRS